MSADTLEQSPATSVGPIQFPLRDPPVNALEWLAAVVESIPPVTVVYGDEPFLKRLALKQLARQVLGDEDGEFASSRVEGKVAMWRDIQDELTTVPLFGGGRRLVIIDDADEFVTRNRPALEDYLERPAKTGVLALEVQSWPSSTKLYKAVARQGLPLECAAPTGAKLTKWLTAWARDTHSAKLEPAAAAQLVEIVGPELGLLDQELAKLAAFAGPGAPITDAMVQELVGGWRTKTTWEMLDAALSGDAREALVQLDKLLLSGESPIALVAQMGSSLRRFAAATRAIEQAEAEGRRITLRQALEQAGVKSFVLSKSEPQLRQLGRQRAAGLYRALLEVDLGLKGKGALPPRLLLERLIVSMSRAAAAPART